MHRSVKLLRCTPFVQQRLSLYSPEVELAGDRKDHHALPSLDRLDDLERHACRSAFRRCRPGALYGTLMPWISRRIMSHVTLASLRSIVENGDRPGRACVGRCCHGSRPLCRHVDAGERGHLGRHGTSTSS